MKEQVTIALKGHGIALDALRKAGTMLFSFGPSDGTTPSPMRVHVIEARVDSEKHSAASVDGGVWTSFDAVPYSDMWADDALWLPWVVQGHHGSSSTDEQEVQVSFEGHFVFDGGPGPQSRLIAHNCRRTDR